MAGENDIKKAVLFDLDGTLVDTADDLAAAMNYALGAAGLPPAPPAEVRHLVGFGARRMLLRGFELVSGKTPEDAALDEGLNVFLDYYAANIAVHSRPFDGVVALIRELRDKGIATAICTNKREAMSRLLLDELGVSDLFDTVVGADTASAAKPDPAPVFLCMSRTGAQRAVFIGDSDTDIKAAKAAQTPCLVAEFGYGPLTMKSETFGRFSHYAEAGPLIEKAFLA